MSFADSARPATRALLLTLAFFPCVVSAQTPGEVGGASFADHETLAWGAVSAAESYNVYRGNLSQLVAGQPPRCHGSAIAGTSFSTPAEPEPGQTYAYLITAESSAGGEGSAGSDSLGSARGTLGSCGAVMRLHVQNRLGYGANEWTRDRIAALGLQGYIDEQLDPASIDESTNTELNQRLGVLEPPPSIIQMVASQLVRGVYSRRQLEQQVATFWANHFNTYWGKVADLYLGAFPACSDGGLPPSCDPNFPTRAYFEASHDMYEEIEAFRDLAFNGNFRQMLETSALSPAMIIYLDTFGNVAGTANENYARELVELHTMGVAGGYTQPDIEALARVFTGWAICKKELVVIGDPLAPCLAEYWAEAPAGKIVATLVLGNHDCDEKVLFDGTPQMVTLPESCGNPSDGLQDLYMALDAIADHPSTKRFISRKILERFVMENPDEATIDALVAVWNDDTNPQGVGDMREVLRAALTLGAFLDPDRTASKIKTPMEHFISGFRAVRGATDGVTTILGYVVNGQEIPHYNPVPTGWAEIGSEWIDTNNTLTRQNFGLDLTSIDVVLNPGFGSDVIGLLNDNGVSTAPGNAAAIVDFFIDALYGGALTPTERDKAIEYLETDDLGNVSPYDDSRIREAVGILLGYAQFQEQ